MLEFRRICRPDTNSISRHVIGEVRRIELGSSGDGRHLLIEEKKLEGLQPLSGMTRQIPPYACVVL